MLANFLTKKRTSLTNFCSDFQFRGVRRIVNLVDLEKLMLQNEYLDVNIDVDTGENEPYKV